MRRSASPALRRAVPKGSLALNRVQNILNNDIKRQITTAGDRECCFDRSFVILRLRVEYIYSFVSFLSVGLLMEFERIRFNQFPATLLSVTLALFLFSLITKTVAYRSVLA